MQSHITLASPQVLFALPRPRFEAPAPVLQVLRDEHKRAAYDAQRRGSGSGGGFGMGSPAAAASRAWRPGATDFDEAFASWFERQGCAPCSAVLAFRRALVHALSVHAQPRVWNHGGRFARNMEEKINEQILKERREAQRMARAAAWEAEKAEAQANRVRAARWCLLKGRATMPDKP